MKVLVVTTGYPTPESPVSGVFVREHARAAARDAEVAVIHLDRSPTHRGGMSLQRLDDDLPTWRVSYPWRPVPVSAALHFAAAAKAWRAVARSGFRPDVVHAHFFLAGVPAALLGRRHRIPVVVSEHWSVFLPEDPMQLRAPLRWGASFAYRSAAAVLPVSEALRRGIELHGLHARRFEIVRNVVDTDLFTADGAARSDRLIAVGLLYDAKGYDVLLGALRNIDARLDIVGDGPLRGELEQLARTNGVSDRVVFRGLLPKSEVARMMRTSSLFVLPSRYDNNPCAVMEALVSGLPVVASAVGGVPELVTAANGRLVEPGDPDALAREITAALGSSYDRDAIAADARREYGADAIAEKLAAVYRSVMQERP